MKQRITDIIHILQDKRGEAVQLLLRLAPGAFIVLYPAFGEAIFSAETGFAFGLPKLLAALALGLMMLALGSATGGRITDFVLQAAAAVGLSLLWMSQLVYYEVFETPYILASVGGAGQILQFYAVIFRIIWEHLPALLALAAQIGLLFVVYRPAVWPERPAPRQRMLRAAAFLCALAVSLGVSFADRGIAPLLQYDFQPMASADALGIGPMTALDFKCNVLGLTRKQSAADVDLDALSVDVATTPTPSAPAVIPTPEENEAAPPPTPTPVVRVPNVLPIEFDPEESDDTLRDMNLYFSQADYTMTNEYTGMFEGYDLIQIVAEGFSGYVIDPELTPTLYRLASQGFVFSNFYTPVWGVSTSDGEYVSTTGLIPKPGVWSYTEIADNYMPFAFGNQFSKLGYTTLAFHDHTYTYYNRDRSYPAMGYTYYGKGSGLEVTAQWPESDAEMMELSVPMYVNEEHFQIYYLTVSGHLEYNFGGNMMAYKHQTEVEDLPYSTAVRAYIACQLELEEALTSLLDQLEAAGRLETTVIALSADHYPYGLTEEQYAELRGVDSLDPTFDLYKNSLLLWSASMSEPVYIDKYCCSLDIAPTLANLFGLPFDSRLYMGRDILSDTEGLVIFNSRSFITDRLMYNAAGGSVTLFDETLQGEALKAYLSEKIELVSDRFYYSTKIIDTDYYRYLFPQP